MSPHHESEPVTLAAPLADSRPQTPRRLRRLLKRKLALSVVEVALLLALWSGAGEAATINVDGSTCTLVDAITSTNSDSATGGCTAGSGADTLVLVPGSTHTLTASNNTTYGPTGLPVVTSTITLLGNGSTVERDSGESDFRLLAVDSSGDLTVQQLTLTGGVASGSFPGERGGGVYNAGTLSLSQCTLSGNSASNYGGGVFNSFGTVTLSRSIVSGNTASTGPEINHSSSTANVDATNLFGHSGNDGLSGVTAGGSDITPSDALSAILDSSLAFNGGVTQTLNLVSASPAIDQIALADCTTTRFWPRCRALPSCARPGPSACTSSTVICPCSVCPWH